MKRSVLILALLAAACGQEKTERQEPTGPIQPAKSAPFLVDAAWLKANRDSVVLVDMQSSKDLYEKGHIAGAVYANVEDFRDDGIKDLLPTDELEEVLGDLGIDENTYVVVYDEKRGRNATWLWFTLTELGHGEVSLLDGQMDGFELVSGPPPAVEKKTYRARREPPDIVDMAYVQGRIGKALMVDARPHGQYTAEKPKKKMKGGHIEGAVNVPYLTFVGEDGKYLSKDAARKKFEAIVGHDVAPDDEIVLYCNSYHEGAHVQFQLARLGYTNLKAYDPGMKEWEKKGLPLKTGDQP
jgi:thiosulfate/3-mercaptopyruvate sulfurtransferase